MVGSNAGPAVLDPEIHHPGFRPGPAERSVAFTLPASGVFTVATPSEYLAGVLTLDAAPSSGVDLQAIRGNIRSPYAACRVEKGALAPECSVLTDGRDSLSVFVVRGPPGTRGHVEWAPYRNDSTTVGFGGYYADGKAQMKRKGKMDHKDHKDHEDPMKGSEPTQPAEPSDDGDKDDKDDKD